MRVVQMTVIRAISVLSILFATAGFYLMGTSIIHRLASDASSKNAAYFWSRIVVNGAFLALLTVSARYIWQIRPFGLRLSNILFALEVGYVFGSPPVEAWLTGSGVLNASNLASTSGVGDLGLAPQMLTLFPFIALLLLNAFWPTSYSSFGESQTSRPGEVS